MTAFLGGQGLTVTSVSIKGKEIKDKRVLWRQAVKHEEPQWTEFKQEFTCRQEIILPQHQLHQSSVALHHQNTQ